MLSFAAQIHTKSFHALVEKEKQSTNLYQHTVASSSGHGSGGQDSFRFATIARPLRVSFDHLTLRLKVSERSAGPVK